jgi:hypothetical protein
MTIKAEPVKNEFLVKRRAALEAVRDAVLKKAAPLNKQREAAWNAVAAATAKWKGIGDRIEELKADVDFDGLDFRGVCNEIAALTRALGTAGSLKAEPGEYGITGKEK